MGSEPILVSGPVELQTLIFGWYMYDQLWTILQDTGLAFLPFLAMIINHFFEPITATYTTSAAQLSLKRMEWNLIRMLIVIVLAGQPFMDISLGNYKLLDLCDKDGDGNFKNLQTLRAEAKAIDKNKQIAPIAYSQGQDTKKAKVPLWWYAVMSVSTGFTEAAKASVPCVNDFRKILSDTLAASSITGTDAINAELQSFINQCHRPAKLAYDRLPSRSFESNEFEGHAKRIKDAIEAAESGDFVEDVTHVGSIFFRGLGSRTGDGSGDGWPNQGAAAAATPTGNDQFYDRLVVINNWNADGQPRLVSCRQWWGFGGSGGTNNEQDIAQTTGVYRLYKLAEYVNGSKDDRFVEGGTNDGMPKSNANEVPFSVMRQLGFRLWVLLAVRTGIVHFKSYSQFNAGIYISPGNYADLALDKIIAAEQTASDVKFNVRKVSRDFYTGDTDVEDLIDWYEENSPAQAAIYAREQINKYIKENVTDVAVVPSDGGTTPGFTEKLKRGIGTFGLTIAAIGTYMTAYVARTSFPYMQALLLCGIYLFLGVGLVFSGYTLEYMYAGAMAIFTLKFMAFIFYICGWLDNNLIVLVTGDNLLAAIGGSISGTTGYSSLLFGSIAAPILTIYGVLKGMYDNVELIMIDYATAGLYFTLPSLFATVMAWAGVRGAEAIGEMQKAQQPLTQAGAQGGQMAQKMAAGAVSGGVGMAAGAVGGAAVGVATGIGLKAGAMHGAGLGKYLKK